MNNFVMNAARRGSRLVQIPSQALSLLNINFFSNHSEEIARYMIEKVISYAISRIFIKKVEEELPHECFDFTKKVLSTYIKTQFITYDKDEYNHSVAPSFTLDDTEQKSQSNISEVFNNQLRRVSTNNFDLSNKFYNNFYHGDNNWDLISEPEVNSIDRYASAMIGYEKFQRNNKVRMSCPAVDALQRVNEENSFSKTNTSMNLSFQQAKRNLSRASTKKKSFADLNFNNTENVDNSNKENKRKQILAVINEFSFHDLPEEPKKEDIDSTILEELRKEKEIELHKVEEEKKIIVQKEKEIQIKIKEEIQKKQDLSKKKVTVDAKGNIVYIKSIKLEKLANDFISVKAQLKNVMQKQSSKVVTKKRQSIAFNTNEPPPAPVVLNNFVRKNKKNGTKINFIDNPKIQPVINDNDSKASSKYEKKIDRGPILPSGSCFDTIALEVGVNMIENTKQKTGGKDFFKRYNKYSMETYNKQLKDTMTTNTMMTNPGYRSLPRLFTSTDYNNTNTNNLTETYSSNLYGANNTSSIAFKKRNLSTLTGSNFMKTTSSNANEFNPLLKATNSMMLRTALETGDDYNEPLSVNRKDIFKEKAKEKQSRTKQLDEMNIFARTILSNDKWGSGVMNNTTKNKGITLPSKGKKNLNEFRSTGSFKKLPRGDRLRATHSKFTLSMDNFAFLNK